MTFEQLETAAHRASVENENAWQELLRAEATLVVLRRKQQQAALRALQAQMELTRAVQS